MLKYIFLIMCLGLLSCGGGSTEDAKELSVTNGGLVLGIVPAGNKEQDEKQRYRLMVCRRMASTASNPFANRDICRSALLTKEGGDVDLVLKGIDPSREDTQHSYPGEAGVAPRPSR